jgi:hypothetical protein
VSVAVSTATITWTTNEEADSAVEYKKSGEAEYRAGVTDPLIATLQSHVITLRNLDQDTNYTYRIKSKDAAGNVQTTGEFSFKTGKMTISDIEIKKTTSSVTISWKTAMEANSQLEYQKQGSTEPSRIEGSGEMVKEHLITIKNLTSGLYSYKLKSIDADKNMAETALATFDIPSTDTSVISAPQAGKIEEQEITATSVKITWKTSVDTTSWIDYGTERGKYTDSTGLDQMTSDHVVSVEGLTPDTTYYYIVRGKDVNGIEYKSAENSFIAVAKPIISDVKVENLTPYSADITFRTNTNTNSTVSYGATQSLGMKAGNEDMGRDHKIELKNLEDNTPYYYLIEVKDKAGNITKSEVAAFATPMDKEGAKIDKVKIDLLPIGESDEFAQAIISWETNKPATTKVEYDEGMLGGGRYSKSSIEDMSLNNTHTVIIKDLNPAATYRFRIVSKDKRGNVSNSSDFNFVTPAKEKSILQLILKSLEETFSWVGNLGNFFKGLGKKTS